MSGTNAIPASTGTAPETPSLDIKPINHSEALNLVSLALQKYPDFAPEVSKVLSAIESRKRLEAIKARRESVQRWYSNLTGKFTEELDRAADYYPGSTEYMDDEYDGVDEVLLGSIITKVAKSVDKKTGDGTFEFAFTALLDITTNLEEGCKNARYDDEFSTDWEGLIYGATEATAKMAFLWITKEGKINKKIQAKIWALLDRGFYSCCDWDDFKVDLEGRIEDRKMKEETRREQNKLKRKRIVE